MRQRSRAVPTSFKLLGSSWVPGWNSTTSRVESGVGWPTRIWRTRPLPGIVRVRNGAPGRSNQTRGPMPPRPAS